MRFRFFVFAISAALLAWACQRSGVDPETAAELQQVRNLGKALYETPGSAEQAVEALAKAVELAPDSARDRVNYGLALLSAGEGAAGMEQLLEAQRQAPEIPHTWFNLGVEYKKAGETDKAIRQFEKMVELAPDEAKAVYNLAQMYKQADRTDEAIRLFERASELDPSLAAPHFQLFNIFRRSDPARAKQEIAAFQRIKKLQDETGLDEDVDWSFYSELYDPVEASPPAEKVQLTQFEPQTPVDLGKAQRSGAIPLDKSRVLAWSESGVAILSPGKDAVTMGVEGLRHLALGDADNDGEPDGCLVDAKGVRRLVIGEKSVSIGDAWLEGDFETCLFHDYDHDGDQDLFIGGEPNRLLQNQGKGEWAPVEFPFGDAGRGMAAVAVELTEDNGIDLVLAHAGGVSLYQDRKLGVYDGGELIAGVDPPGAGPVRLDVVDLDDDGLFDVVLTPATGRSQILLNKDGKLEAGPKIPRALAWGDWQNRGAADFLRPEGVALSRGGMRFEAGDSKGLPADIVSAAAADLNADGRVDLAVVDASGKARIALNRTQTSNAWASVTLQGVKSAVRAQGARVEVKAGSTYRKQLYQGGPLHFGLGGARSIETVRVTWTNGMIQNEIEQPVSQAFVYEEKPRLSGSCPMIFTWNGKEFEYIGEVLGVAPLGASLGGGQFFPVDHDEAIWIRGDQLVVNDDGFLEVRITEELREVAYLDEVKLLAVDHPVDVEVYTNEKFKGPPFPEFALYGVREEQKIRPQRAVDHRSRDVLPRLRARDGGTVDGFERTFRNTAELHAIEFSLDGLRGDDRSRLFLTGWADWADASTIVAGSQHPDAALRMPSLQVRNPRGEWETVIEDLGLPGGQMRTMSVDLTGRFLSNSRDVRIVTNLCVYWDEVFAADGVDAEPAVLTSLLPEKARLSFRGFSRNIVHPKRLQAERFLYAELRSVSNWNPTPGLYTRYGDVTELLGEIDDRFVVLGAGDEARLLFRTPKKGPQSGWQRDYVLVVDGWAKEQEANTAFGDSVEPLPFHEMTAYPYPKGEAFPTDAAHREYLESYQVRPALRLIRPLARRP